MLGHPCHLRLQNTSPVCPLLSPSSPAWRTTAACKLGSSFNSYPTASNPPHCQKECEACLGLFLPAWSPVRAPHHAKMHLSTPHPVVSNPQTIHTFFQRLAPSCFPLSMPINSPSQNFFFFAVPSTSKFLSQAFPLCLQSQLRVTPQDSFFDPLAKDLTLQLESWHPSASFLLSTPSLFVMIMTMSWLLHCTTCLCNIQPTIRP